MTPVLEDKLDAILRDHCENTWAAVALKQKLKPLIAEAERDAEERALLVVNQNDNVIVRFAQ